MAGKKVPKMICPICSIQDIIPGRKDVTKIGDKLVHDDCFKKKHAKITIFS